MVKDFAKVGRFLVDGFTVVTLAGNFGSTMTFSTGGGGGGGGGGAGERGGSEMGGGGGGGGSANISKALISIP